MEPGPKPMVDALGLKVTCYRSPVCDVKITLKLPGLIPAEVIRWSMYHTIPLLVSSSGFLCDSDSIKWQFLWVQTVEILAEKTSYRFSVDMHARFLVAANMIDYFHGNCSSRWKCLCGHTGQGSCSGQDWG